MILAISSSGPGLDSPIDERFGRAPGFVIIDLESGDVHWLDNAACGDMAHGAGIQAAQNVADSGAKAVITGRVGPKAEQALRQGGVAIHVGAQGTVADSVEMFKQGTLRSTS